MKTYISESERMEDDLYDSSPELLPKEELCCDMATD